MKRLQPYGYIYIYILLYTTDGKDDAVSLHRVNASVWDRRSTLTFRHEFCAYDTIINYWTIRGFQRVSKIIIYHYYSVQRPIDRARPNARFIFKRQRSPMPRRHTRSSIYLYNIQNIYIYVGRCIYVHLDLSSVLRSLLFPIQ